MILVILIALRHLLVLVWDTWHTRDQLVPFRLLPHSILHIGGLLALHLEAVGTSVTLRFYISSCTHFLNILRQDWMIGTWARVCHCILVQDNTLPDSLA